jgi:integrator complex subunit 6
MIALSYMFTYFQPPRTAHPNVKFTCTAQEPLVIENVPFDKYELEPSPLTQYILSRKQPTVCWQVRSDFI